MSKSIKELLQHDMECEGLLECFHGLTDLDRNVFKIVVANNEPLTVDEIATQVERERTTAYRSVQRLLENGFIVKDQVNYEEGGYHHVYHARDSDEITNDLQRMLNDWYAQMGQLIDEFDRKYETTAEPNETTG